MEPKQSAGKVRRYYAVHTIEAEEVEKVLGLDMIALKILEETTGVAIAYLGILTGSYISVLSLTF
ncbi:unnamed protein product [Ceratitis capitata]|uniref:(Mediterranean fruit fly) hypothetical protein n=1 Tax=Ceratitis capitata TaxID=7213 RepID=A0A811V5N0_CERCA|nr:unnamed protein product [Ceratitis capitata]